MFFTLTPMRILAVDTPQANPQENHSDGIRAEDFVLLYGADVLPPDNRGWLEAVRVF